MKYKPCRFCNQEVTKPNHAKWCDQNPNRQNAIKNLKKAQQKQADDTLGLYMYFTVDCDTCNKIFEVEEREKQFPKKDKYYCSRSCANSVGGTAKSNNLLKNGKLYYRTLGLKFHGKKCISCGYDKVIAIHHIDHDRTNNDKNNLVPLCPNCHALVHWKNGYKDEVLQKIKEFQTGG